MLEARAVEGEADARVRLLTPLLKGQDTKWSAASRAIERRKAQRKTGEWGGEGSNVGAPPSRARQSASTTHGYDEDDDGKAGNDDKPLANARIIVEGGFVVHRVVAVGELHETAVLGFGFLQCLGSCSLVGLPNPWNGGSVITFKEYKLHGTQDEASNSIEGRDYHLLISDETGQLPVQFFQHSIECCHPPHVDINGVVFEPTVVWMGRPGAVDHWIREVDQRSRNGENGKILYPRTHDNPMFWLRGPDGHTVAQ